MKRILNLSLVLILVTSCTTIRFPTWKLVQTESKSNFEDQKVVSQFDMAEHTSNQLISKRLIIEQSDNLNKRKQGFKTTETNAENINSKATRDDWSSEIKKFKKHTNLKANEHPSQKTNSDPEISTRIKKLKRAFGRLIFWNVCGFLSSTATGVILIMFNAYFSIGLGIGFILLAVVLIFFTAKLVAFRNETKSMLNDLEKNPPEYLVEEINVRFNKLKKYRWFLLGGFYLAGFIASILIATSI